MSSESRYFEDVAVGDGLSPLKKEINLARMMAYGATTWDFIRFHYDADYVREQGFKAPFVDGQMFGGFLIQHVQDWAGPAAFVCKLGFRNRVMVFPGDSITCRGIVTGVYLEGEEGLIECDLWVDNQNGEKVIQPASALIRLPRGSA